MTKQKRAKLIKKYAAGYDEVARALEGLPARKLTARPFRGKWTAAEIVHHLADSEMTGAVRLRLLLAEDGPVIHAYDQDAFVARLRYNERDIAPALEAFRAARSTTVQLLERMTAKDWARQAWHSENGAYGTERWLEIYVVHAHNHAKQIARLRAAVTAKGGGTRRKRNPGR
ncbi:MAG TPA: DinB family protein [Thermoanaerobaculaceae bacterium]|nr:DinB family protein [Thermoanaerobaculaceae bacterium]